MRIRLKNEQLKSLHSNLTKEFIDKSNLKY